MTNAGTTSEVTILDFAVTLSIHYDVPYQQGTLSYNVIVDAQLDTLGWFTIFDYTAPDEYTTASYNLATIYDLSNDNFTVGATHTMTFRCKGDGSVMCGLRGSYLAFDEKTKIVD
jgi:hypothetical protein